LENVHIIFNIHIDFWLLSGAMNELVLE